MTSAIPDKPKISCLLCESSSIETVVRLPPSPLANALHTPNDSQRLSQNLYPLELGICGNCGHLQLTTLISPDILFSDYPYLSNSNAETSRRFNELSEELDSFFSNSTERFAIELGSNDGYLLGELSQRGWEVLGVDPSTNAARIANFSGITTICDFFSKSLADVILSDHRRPELIIANNVLAHTDQMKDIFWGISSLMNENTLFVMEFSYAVDVYEKLLFDTIYHEHMSYHQILPLKRFLSIFGLKIVDAVKFDSHGGSLRLYVRMGLENSESERLLRLIENEEKLELNTARPWNNFQSRIQELGNEVRSLLIQKAESGMNIVGYGVPAKFSTLFHSLELKSDWFSSFVDDNQLKVGRIVPGTDREVMASTILEEKPADYIFLFSWNYSSVLIEKIIEKNLATKGIIIPLPDFRLINL